MQFFGQGKPPQGVIFDCDLGNGIDDALALAILYGLDGKNECRVTSISVSKPNIKAAALAEVIGRFYAGAVSGAFAAIGRTLPVGLNIAAKMDDDTPMLTVPLARKNPDGTPTYQHGIHGPLDTAETPALLRNALTSQHDGNAMAVLLGPATNFARILDLPGVKELITRKLKHLVVMGGNFPTGKPEFNIEKDIPAARKLFADWPGPIVAVGAEIGDQIRFPGAAIEKDFAWSPAHPVADAYRAYKPMPYDAEAWDPAAVLYAVRPNENYFKLSEPGVIEVLANGQTKFTTGGHGRHRHLIFDPTQKEKIEKTFVELASAKPVVRQRFRRPPVEQKQPPPPAAPLKP